MERKMKGDLVEGMELLSLVWSEVGGGLVVEDERLMTALVESFGRWSRCGRKKK
jgi:hydroxymethylglutaryl-CoA reductase